MSGEAAAPGTKKFDAGMSAVLTDLQGIDDDVFLGNFSVDRQLFHHDYAQNVFCRIKVAPYRWVQPNVHRYLSQGITAENCARRIICRRVANKRQYHRRGDAAFNDRWRRVRGGGDLRRRVRELVSVSVPCVSPLSTFWGVDFRARILICPYIPSVNSLRPRLTKSFTPLSSASTFSSSSPVESEHNLSTYHQAGIVRTGRSHVQLEDLTEDWISPGTPTELLF